MSAATVDPAGAPAPPAEPALAAGLQACRTQLLAAAGPHGPWRGRLSESALATAVACLALHRLDAEGQRRLIDAATAWLAADQNPDGGWGDTPESPSNLSTTLLGHAALTAAAPGATAARRGAERFLTARVGGAEPDRIEAACLAAYGADRTFSAPILMVCALAGTLGPAATAWPRVPQLPCELAALPEAFFRHLGLPVVSYALPALIAVGLARHHETGPTPGHGLRGRLRDGLRARLLRKLAALQPPNGGFLEATPLTAFVTLALLAAGEEDHPVVRRAAAFLRAGRRPSGAWPIDTDLATWTTTLAVRALGGAPALGAARSERLAAWLRDRQCRRRHPYTGAAPGGWAWTDLPGGVPDADDTAGALLALAALAPAHPATREAAAAGVRWLLGLQNRDGGIPTFCRGWGRLPFDRSAPDLTAHALQALAVWEESLPRRPRRAAGGACRRALSYLVRAQRTDGAWEPLWFGSQETASGANPALGTARVLQAYQRLAALGRAVPAPSRERGRAWLLSRQQDDGGWGADRGARPTVEETALAVTALAGEGEAAAAQRGAAWLLRTTRGGTRFPAAPIGLYFAKLWYAEALYPLVFTTEALRAAAALPAPDRGRDRP